MPVSAYDRESGEYADADGEDTKADLRNKRTFKIVKYL